MKFLKHKTLHQGKHIQTFLKYLFIRLKLRKE
jgi:hypothetical protein